MKNEFIPYEQSLVLKELGFDESCFGYYVGLGDNKENLFKLVQIKSEKGQFEWIDNVYHAPTFSQAFRWFRENHFLNCKIFRDGGWWIGIVHSHEDEDYSSPEDKFNTYDLGVFNTYEEAELACLIKLIEIVKS